MTPMREASTKCVDVYVASVWDRLRTALWEVQAQSMAEANIQKWYYDRKIGTVNLRPGDLALVKADAFKGKRKIKDRWEEVTWEVVHQVMADIPSTTNNKHGRSSVPPLKLTSLVMSEIGIPLCMGSIIHGTGVPVPPHARLPLQEVKGRGHHKSKVVRQSPDDLPVKLPGVEK